MKLHIVPAKQYPQVLQMIAPEHCGAVYPLSVVREIQSGIVLADDTMQTILVWHCCGFAFLYGRYDRPFLETVGQMLRNPTLYSQMLLFAPDDDTAAYFQNQGGFLSEQRLFFRYPAEKCPPECNAATIITPEILPQIQGKITPAFSWTASADFLKNGRGFCVMQDNMPAAWAFSAAISDQEIDIGVETDAQFRRRGFAFDAAAAMCRDIISHGKTPVWACHAANIASQTLAAALGFVPAGHCITIKWKP